MSKSRSSPRKFAEKIALIREKEADSTAAFENIIKEVERTTRAVPHIPPAPITTRIPYQNGPYYIDEQQEYLPRSLHQRSSSFSNWQSYERQQSYYTDVAQEYPINVRYNSHAPPPQQQQQSYLNNQYNVGMIENNRNDVHQTTSLDVPAIEIYDIDDTNQTFPQNNTPYVISSPSQDRDCTNYEPYTNNGCSTQPLPISSSRSLPDIANISENNHYVNTRQQYLNSAPRYNHIVQQQQQQGHQQSFINQNELAMSNNNNNSNLQHQQSRSPMEVPNIALYPITDNNESPPHQNPESSIIDQNQHSPDRECIKKTVCSSSPLSISSSRSLPDIANLSVSGASPVEQYMQQPVTVNHRLAPVSNNFACMSLTRSSEDVFYGNGNQHYDYTT